MNRPAPVLITANFERNLDEIRTFLVQQGSPEAFARLLDISFDPIIPNLERFPGMGRDLLSRQPLSFEGLARRERLQNIATTREIREYIHSDYVLLYASDGEAVHLLSIKHHRQLSFDLKGNW